MVAWGTKTSLGSQTAINNTVEEFLNTVDMSAALQAHIQLEVDNESGTVTDALIVNVYTTLDDSSEDWDEVPFMSFTVLPTVVTAVDTSFVVSGVYRFRIGLLSTGATNAYTVGGNYRLRTA